MRALGLSLLVLRCVSASTVQADGLGEKAAEAKAARAVKARPGEQPGLHVRGPGRDQDGRPGRLHVRGQRHDAGGRSGGRGPNAEDHDRYGHDRCGRTSPPGSAWVAARADRALRVSSSTTGTACCGRENRDDGEARSRSPAAWALRCPAPILSPHRRHTPHSPRRPTPAPTAHAGPAAQARADSDARTHARADADPGADSDSGPTPTPAPTPTPSPTPSPSPTPRPSPSPSPSPTPLPRQYFPTDTPWYEDVSDAPLDPDSATVIAYLGRGRLGHRPDADRLLDRGAGPDARRRRS